MLIAHSVELLRDPQIEGLPCELVTPVRLLLKETHVPIPTFLVPTSPKRVEHLIRRQSLSCRPWIVSEILRFPPVSPLLYRAPPRHSLPKCGCRAPELAG
jgi:hypothetical protein